MTGLFLVVLGLLQSRTYDFGASRQDFTIGNTAVIPKGDITPVWIYLAIGAVADVVLPVHGAEGEKARR